MPGKFNVGGLIGILIMLLFCAFIEPIINGLVYLPVKIWGYFDKGRRLKIAFYILLALLSVSLFLSRPRLEIYGGYVPTLAGFSLSGVMIIPLVKFLEKLAKTLGNRMPFWIGSHTRAIPKDFTPKEHGMDFLLNWLTIPVLVPLVIFFFFSFARFFWLLGRDFICFVKGYNVF